MRIEPTDIDGVALLHWELSRDERGGFARVFCQAELANAGLPFTVVQANLSRNTRRHTLRGLHYQKAPYGEPKIISCVRGRIWEVVVDIRPRSRTYRRWFGLELAPDSDCALHVAPGVANGFLTLEPNSEVSYLMGADYVPEAAAGLRWDDPELAIAWPAAPTVISERDRSFPLLEADRLA